MKSEHEFLKGQKEDVNKLNEKLKLELEGQKEEMKKMKLARENKEERLKLELDFLKVAVINNRRA